MALRRVIKAFRAVRIPRGNVDSCRVLEGYDNSGDFDFEVGAEPLNDGSYDKGEIVDGEEFVRFTFSQRAFCISRLIFEDATEILPPTDSGKSFP